MIGLVLDTNVVISANLLETGLQARVLSFALSEHARLYVSAAILEEYERVLRYPRLQFSPQQIAAFLALVRRSSILVHPTQVVTKCQDERQSLSGMCRSRRRSVPGDWQQAAFPWELEGHASGQR